MTKIARQQKKPPNEGGSRVDRGAKIYKKERETVRIIPNFLGRRFGPVHELYLTYDLATPGE